MVTADIVIIGGGIIGASIAYQLALRACGFSGHGFMHAPMAAKLLVELILDGHTTTLPIEPFNIRRFRNGQLLKTMCLL